jgi:hypothetical protein
MSSIFNVNNLRATAISRGRSPKHPAQLFVPLDFSVDPTILFSLNVTEGVRNVSGIDGIQSVFIDNGSNSAQVQIVFDTGQTLYAQPYSQEIFPVFFSGQLLNFRANCPNPVVVNLIFVNTREQAQQWKGYTSPHTTATNRSQALAAGGVAQVLMPANALRAGFFIQNPASAASEGIAIAESVYVNLTGAAVINGANCIELLPGDRLTSAEFGQTVPTDAINWIAATIGHQIIAKEY